MNDYQNLFIINLQNQYRMAGRLPNDAMIVYTELLHGNFKRLQRELGVKPRNIEQLKIINEGNLQYNIKYGLILLHFTRTSFAVN